MGYEGHLQPLRDRSEREARTRDAMEELVATAQRIRAAGLPCDIVSAGGTGTYDISGRVDGVTEIQAGSYALMDTDYGRVGVPFEQAFWVLGTMVSRPAPSRCVADCGHKSMTKDHGHPSVQGIDGATVTALNDEHATIALPASCTLAIGDRVAVASVAHRPDRQPPRRLLRGRGRAGRGRVADRRARIRRTPAVTRTAEPAWSISPFFSLHLVPGNGCTSRDREDVA